MEGRPVVIERLETPRGELVLRRVGEHLEIVSTGVFLMDTRDGRSERLLASAPLAVHERPRRVLVCGLGVGTTLATVLADDRVESVVVVEVEDAVIRWFGAGLADDRVELVVGDVADVGSTYDVICLDVDNGPEWTVTPANAKLYDDAGTAALRARLAPGGVLAVWSARPSPAYELRLGKFFAEVAVHDVEVERGDPDVIYVAR